MSSTPGSATEGQPTEHRQDVGQLMDEAGRDIIKLLKSEKSKTTLQNIPVGHQPGCGAKFCLIHEFLGEKKIKSGYRMKLFVPSGNVKVKEPSGATRTRK
jgi:hypothetical protein